MNLFKKNPDQEIADKLRSAFADVIKYAAKLNNRGYSVCIDGSGYEYKGHAIIWYSQFNNLRLEISKTDMIKL